MVIKSLIKLQKSQEFHLRLVHRHLKVKEKNTGFNKEIPKERFISPEEKQKIIDDLRLI